MATWKNLDTLDSFGKLKELKNHVDIAAALSGEEGGKRVADYSTPMAAGLSYNYAAKEVDETVLSALAKLADEAQLIDKFQELYNGAVINTGENRMVLHHLARKQLGNPVVVDGVDKREFYVAQQKKAVRYLRAGLIMSFFWGSSMLMNVLTTLMNANVIGRYAGVAAINFSTAKVLMLVAASLLLLVCIVGFVDCPRGLHRAKKKIAALEAERVIQE